MPLFDIRIMIFISGQVYKFLYYGLRLHLDTTYIHYDFARITIILETNYKMKDRIGFFLSFSLLITQKEIDTLFYDISHVSTIIVNYQ